MLVLAMLTILAAPAAHESTSTATATPQPVLASLPRVPGTRLRLGMSESQLQALGKYPEFQAPNAGTMTARRGPGRFFGVPGQATCFLRDGLLAEVRFEAAGVGPHSQDYIDGQLRMTGLARQCDHDLEGDRTCDWIAPRLHMHTEMNKDHLTVRVVPWPPLADHAPDSLRARTTPPTAASRTHAASPTPTGAAKAQAPARDSTRRVAPAIATLPETLTITPASRNSPNAWPRILSGQPLQYPKKAKQESIQGVVWVTALVDTSGKVMNASIERGIRELNDAALAWVSASQFTPCHRNGAPYRYVVRVAVLFTLF